MRHLYDRPELWYWQGLRWAPGGLLLLATAAAATLPLPGPARWVGWLTVALTAARLHGLAGRYYARNFPQVRPGARTAGGLTAAAVLLVALAVDSRWTPPVLVTAAVGAVVLIGYGVATGGARPHQIGGVAVLAALAPLPALGIVDGGRSRVLLWLVACGVLYPVVALLDHRELALRRRAWRHAVHREGRRRQRAQLSRSGR